MGKKKKEIKRVVLDTNILVSALIFKGEVSRLVKLWKTGKIVPVISQATFKEFKEVLAYPKFSLTMGEIKTIIEDEILPFFEVIDVREKIGGLCRDPEDDKFLACALSASANYIVSGDKDLCDISRYKSIKIVKVSEFLKMFGSSPI